MKHEHNPNNLGGETPSFPLRSIIACTVLLATAAFTSADVTLKGHVGPRTIEDDVIIARGTTCVLNGTTIKGSVRVLSNAKLYMNGAWVDGTVYAYRSELVDIRDASRVTWNVRANRTNSIRVREESQIGGHMRITYSMASDDVDALLLKNSVVIGDVVAKNNKGRLRTMYNAIEGNLKFEQNKQGLYAIRNNDIWKNLKFIRNTGNGSIIQNDVGGNLESSGNSPHPRIRRNDVRGSTRTE